MIVREEPFASAQVEAALVEAGVEVRTGCRAIGVSRDGDGVEVELEDGESARGAELLVAVGRKPATEELGLETVGLEPGKPVEVGSNLRSPRHDWLYAIGDANGRALLTHMGKYQGRLAADAILGKPVALRSDGALSPRVIFTDPQVAAVGHTVGSAEAAGMVVRAVDVETSGSAGASFVGRNAPGTSRLVVDDDRGVIVGATFVGVEVAELLHAATIAVVAEVPLDRLVHAVPAFPTRSELWLQLLEAAGCSRRVPGTVPGTRPEQTRWARMPPLDDLLNDLFRNDALLRAVLSKPRSAELPRKVTVEPVGLRGATAFQITTQLGDRATHENLASDEARERLGVLLTDYRQGLLQTADADWQVLGGKVLRRPATRTTAARRHDRRKRYLLEEGTPVPFLVELGVMTADGTVRKSRYDKFRQINRFLELVDDVVPSLPPERDAAHRRLRLRQVVPDLRDPSSADRVARPRGRDRGPRPEGRRDRGLLCSRDAYQGRGSSLRARRDRQLRRGRQG